MPSCTPPRVELGFTVPDVKAFYREISAKGINAASAPTLQYASSESTNCACTPPKILLLG